METHPADPRRRPTRPRSSEDLRVDLTQDGDRYLVNINDVQVTEVYKSRMETDRYSNMGGVGWNRGRTRWMVGNINDEDYGTRKEAVAEIVRRYRIKLEQAR